MFNLFRDNNGVAVFLSHDNTCGHNDVALQFALLPVWGRKELVQMLMKASAHELATVLGTDILNMLCCGLDKVRIYPSSIYVLEVWSQCAAGRRSGT